MKAKIDDMCLSSSDYRALALTARKMILARKQEYRGSSFEGDLSLGSGLPQKRIAEVLEVKESDLPSVRLTGLDWERLLAASQIYSEDLLNEAKIVFPPVSSKFEYAFGHDGSMPSESTDRRIRGLLEVMNDFFILATINSLTSCPLTATDNGK